LDIIVTKNAKFTLTAGREIIAFFILAVQMFVTIIEFKLTSLAGFILVPFALWNRTSFLAERVLGNVISSGIKVMVLAVIVGIGSGFFTEFTTALQGQEPDIGQAMSLMLASLTLFGLGIFGPAIASGLVAGAPQLGAGAALGTTVTAQVTSKMFDTPTGRILLIPQGSRLIGSYDSVVAFGQKRALVVWRRIMLPDGSSLRMDNVPATDASGYAGLEDKVDFHTWALLKGVALATLLGVGSELTVSGDGDLVQAIRQSTQQNVSRAGDQLTSHNLNIQPTITIRPGATVRLVVHKDLILTPWHG
jgi:hypothetical protein